MTVRDDFGAFILSHGRPESVSRTIGALDRCGYTGKWWIVLDDEDDTADEYRARWGADRVLMFHKDDAHTDMADNGGPRGVIIYARNACEQLAKDKGLTYYWQLDDDYFDFRHRYAEGGSLRSQRTHQLDAVVEAFIEYLDESGALTVAMGQGGDYLGGHERKFFRDRVSRKAMNTFITRVGRPLNFTGRINEDVNTYTLRGHRGDLLLTVSDFSVNQVVTQGQGGGMTDTYVDGGTYVKSFYTVLHVPSAVKVAAMNTVHARMHHSVTWDHCVPKIIPDKWRRES